jgi:hypothetical protein
VGWDEMVRRNKDLCDETRRGAQIDRGMESEVEIAERQRVAYMR